MQPDVGELVAVAVWDPGDQPMGAQAGAVRGLRATDALDLVGHPVVVAGTWREPGTVVARGRTPCSSRRSPRQHWPTHN